MRDLQAFYMNQALNLAQTAFNKGEVPVGALLLKDNQVLSQAFNQKESHSNPLGHAELGAIKQASKNQNSWRLGPCTLYVTLEPCLMCIGAILQSRISHLIYGCPDPKGGFESYYKLTKQSFWNHKLKITSGIQAEKSSQMLKQFFQNLRTTNEFKKHPI